MPQKYPSHSPRQEVTITPKIPFFNVVFTSLQPPIAHMHTYIIYYNNLTMNINTIITILIPEKVDQGVVPAISTLQTLIFPKRGTDLTFLAASKMLGPKEEPTSWLRPCQSTSGGSLTLDYQHTKCIKYELQLSNLQVLHLPIFCVEIRPLQAARAHRVIATKWTEKSNGTSPIKRIL